MHLPQILLFFHFDEKIPKKLEREKKNPISMIVFKKKNPSLFFPNAITVLFFASTKIRT